VYTIEKLGKLSETETEVMCKIWELASPVTTTQLRSVFEESKNWKPSTIATILLRLIEKGFLTKDSHDKTHVYSAKLTFADYQKTTTQHLLHKVFNGNIKDLIAAWVDDDAISKKDVNDLKDWFNELTGDE
jgi:predicted transcriptional regulator